MNAFLNGLPADERARVGELTEHLTSHLQEWAAPYGVFDPKRFATTALTMAAAAAWLPEADLRAMAPIPVWIFTVDACLDEGLFRPEERHERAAHYVAVAGAAPGREPQPLDPYARALRDLQRDIAPRALATDLRPYWQLTCRRMLTSMIAECEAGESGRMPALSTYLEHGLYSIGVPMYLAGAWAFTGDPRLPRELPLLDRLARQSGRAIRLANDLRTHEKERREGNCNALFFVPEAEVRRRCVRATAAVAAAARRLSPPSPAAVLTDRVTRFSVDFYAEHDFHTVERARIHHV